MSRNHADALTIHKGAYTATTDPGAVGAGKLWVDTSGSEPFPLKLRNSTDDGWLLVGTVNVMTTQDDVIVGGASGVPARLAKGTDGQVLTVDPTTHHLLWATPAAAGMTNPMTTLDDLVLGGASGAPARLAKGTDSQVLTVDPTTHHPLWATPAAAGMTNPMTTLDDLVLGGASGTPARLAKGTDSQVLTVDPTTHHPLWATPAAAGMTNPMTATNDIIIGDSGGTPTVMPLGTVGQVLGVDGSPNLVYRDLWNGSNFIDGEGFACFGTQILTYQQGAIAAVASAAAPTQTASYVQADVQAIADLANELKTQLNLALAMLRTHGLIAT